MFGADICLVNFSRQNLKIDNGGAEEYNTYIICAKARLRRDSNIQGEKYGIILPGGIVAVRLSALRQANSRKLILRLIGCLFSAYGCHCLAENEL